MTGNGEFETGSSKSGSLSLRRSCNQCNSNYHHCCHHCNDPTVVCQCDLSETFFADSLNQSFEMSTLNSSHQAADNINVIKVHQMQAHSGTINANLSIGSFLLDRSSSQLQCVLSDLHTHYFSNQSLYRFGQNLLSDLNLVAASDSQADRSVTHKKQPANGNEDVERKEISESKQLVAYNRTISNKQRDHEPNPSYYSNTVHIEESKEKSEHWDYSDDDSDDDHDDDYGLDGYEKKHYKKKTVYKHGGGGHGKKKKKHRPKKKKVYKHKKPKRKKPKKKKVYYKKKQPYKYKPKKKTTIYLKSDHKHDHHDYDYDKKHHHHDHDDHYDHDDHDDYFDKHHHHGHYHGDKYYKSHYMKHKKPKTVHLSLLGKGKSSFAGLLGYTLLCVNYLLVLKEPTYDKHSGHYHTKYAPHGGKGDIVELKTGGPVILAHCSRLGEPSVQRLDAERRMMEIVRESMARSEGNSHDHSIRKRQAQVSLEGPSIQDYLGQIMGLQAEDGVADVDDALQNNFAPVNPQQIGIRQVQGPSRALQRLPQPQSQSQSQPQLQQQLRSNERLVLDAMGLTDGSDMTNREPLQVVHMRDNLAKSRTRTIDVRMRVIDGRRVRQPIVRLPAQWLQHQQHQLLLQHQRQLLLQRQRALLANNDSSDDSSGSSSNGNGNPDDEPMQNDQPTGTGSQMSTAATTADRKTLRSVVAASTTANRQQEQQQQQQQRSNQILDLPDYALSGDTIELTCNHRMATSRLYSVKWFKDSLEFYRFIPANGPGRAKSSLFLPGVRLDLGRSDAQSVYLRNVTHRTSGSYRCEVVSEGPNFETMSGEKRMQVYSLPGNGPRLALLDGADPSTGPPVTATTLPTPRAVSSASQQQQQLPNAPVVRCASSRSSPAAQLRFFINNRPLEASRLLENSTVGFSDGLESNVVSFQVQLGDFLVPSLSSNDNAVLNDDAGGDDSGNDRRSNSTVSLREREKLTDGGGGDVSSDLLAKTKQETSLIETRTSDSGAADANALISIPDNGSSAKDKQPLVTFDDEPVAALPDKRPKSVPAKQKTNPTGPSERIGPTGSPEPAASDKQAAGRKRAVDPAAAAAAADQFPAELERFGRSSAAAGSHQSGADDDAAAANCKLPHRPETTSSSPRPSRCRRQAAAGERSRVATGSSTALLTGDAVRRVAKRETAPNSDAGNKEQLQLEQQQQAIYSNYIRIKCTSLVPAVGYEMTSELSVPLTVLVPMSVLTDAIGGDTVSPGEQQQQRGDNGGGTFRVGGLQAPRAVLIDRIAQGSSPSRSRSEVVYSAGSTSQQQQQNATASGLPAGSRLRSGWKRVPTTATTPSGDANQRARSGKGSSSNGSVHQQRYLAALARHQRPPQPKPVSNGSLSKFSQQAYGLVFGFAQIDHAKRLASLLIFGFNPKDGTSSEDASDNDANWLLQTSTLLCFLVTVVVRLTIYANTIAWLLFCGHKQVITLNSSSE